MLFCGGITDGLGFFGSEERVGWVNFFTHHVSKFEVLLIGGSENHRPTLRAYGLAVVTDYGLNGASAVIFKKFLVLSKSYVF